MSKKSEAPAEETSASTAVAEAPSPSEETPAAPPEKSQAEIDEKLKHLLDDNNDG